MHHSKARIESFPTVPGALHNSLAFARNPQSNGNVPFLLATAVRKVRVSLFSRAREALPALQIELG
jgi:hypothetical protein